MIDPVSEPASTTVMPRPWRAVSLVRVRSVRNRLRSYRQHHPWRFAVQGLAIIAVGFLSCTAVLIGMTGLFINTSTSDESVAVLTALFSLLIVGGVLGSAASALQTLYLSPDLPFMLGLPLPRPVIYVSKFIDATTGSLPIVIISAASALAYGLARGERPLWLVAAGIAILATVIMTTSIGVIVVAGMVRVMPARAGQFVLGGLSLVLLAGLWFGWRQLVRVDSAQQEPTVDLGSIVDRLAQAGTILDRTPFGWAASLVVAAGEGTTADTLRFGLLTLGTTAVMALAAYGAFAVSFTQGLVRLREQNGQQRDARPVVALLALPLRLLPPAIGTLVLKEWLVMFRDLRRLSGALFPLGMVVIYAFLLGREEPNAPRDLPELGFWMAAGPLAILPWGASLGIAIYSVGTERTQINLLRSLPLVPWHVLIAKMIASLVPVLILVEGAAVIVSTLQGASGGQLLGVAGLVGWATVGYVAIDTSAAAIGPNFAAEQVQRSTRFSGRMFGLAAGALFTAALAIATIRLVLFSTGLPSSFEQFRFSAGGVDLLGWPLVVIAALLSVIVVLGSLSIAESHLARTLRDTD